MKQEPTAPRPHRLAPPPIPGLDTTSPNVGYTGEITNGTLPEDWPIFAEIYVPFLAKYPLVQNLLGYRIDQHVLRYGDPPLNPRFNVFTHRHYEVLWLLVFPCRDVASDAEPPHALCAWPSEFTR